MEANELHLFIHSYWLTEPLFLALVQTQQLHAQWVQEPNDGSSLREPQAPLLLLMHGFGFVLAHWSSIHQHRVCGCRFLHRTPLVTVWLSVDHLNSLCVCVSLCLVSVCVRFRWVRAVCQTGSCQHSRRPKLNKATSAVKSQIESRCDSQQQWHCATKTHKLPNKACLYVAYRH